MWLTDADRHHTIKAPQIKCDRQEITEKSWYRFGGESGTQMLTTCIPIRHCNTNAPGWLLNGTHPELHEGIVPRRVCFHWLNDCCYFKTDIRVRSCGSFYVYELGRPSGCHLRYCGEWRLPQLQSNFACMQTLPSAGKVPWQYKLQVLARVTYRNFTW